MAPTSGNLSYLETNLYNVVVNSPPIAPLIYPITLTVEVIDWVTKWDMDHSAKINSFVMETLLLVVAPPSIRDYVYNTLLIKYPTLIK